MIRTRRSSLLWRLLSITVATTTDRARAERSRFMWGMDGEDWDVDGGNPVIYRLRVIGVLGLTVWLEDES